MSKYDLLISIIFLDRSMEYRTSFAPQGNIDYVQSFRTDHRLCAESYTIENHITIQFDIIPI